MHYVAVHTHYLTRLQLMCQKLMHVTETLPVTLLRFNDFSDTVQITANLNSMCEWHTSNENTCVSNVTVHNLKYLAINTLYYPTEEPGSKIMQAMEQSSPIILVSCGQACGWSSCDHMSLTQYLPKLSNWLWAVLYSVQGCRRGKRVWDMPLMWSAWMPKFKSSHIV